MRSSSSSQARESVAARVLIVDDSTAFRRAFHEFLNAQGVAVIGEAASGEDAIKLAQQLQPDIAFIDTRMPGMSGVDVCRQIHSCCGNIRLVLMSASQHETPDLCWESGASTVVPKQLFLEPGGVQLVVQKLMG